MAAWRKEEGDAARHRQEKREAARLGNLLSQLVIADGSVEFCEASPIILVDEPKISLYGCETDRDLRSACRCVACFFSERAVWGVGGGYPAYTFSFVLFSLFSRPRAGLATV